MAKKRISLTAAYTTPYIRVNSFTVDLSDPIIVGGGRNYAYGLLQESLISSFALINHYCLLHVSIKQCKVPSFQQSKCSSIFFFLAQINLC